jgi:Cell division protein CrgA
VPKSRIRRKKNPYPRAATTPSQKRRHRPWAAPVMVTLFVLGLAWIVLFYVTQPDSPLGMSALGDWNIVIGFALIAAGFGVSTQWR